MRKEVRRTPRGYDGSGKTTHALQDMLASFVTSLSDTHALRPDLIILGWPKVVGPSLAPMTEAIAFVDGVLTVKVKNSSLLSLLNQRDKPRVLQALRAQFPQVEIKNIIFRLG